MRLTRYMPTFYPTWRPSTTSKPSFSPTRPWSHLSPAVTAFSRVKKRVDCQAAAQIRSVPVNNVTVVREELTVEETHNTICAEVSTYAQTRRFSWVVDSNATQFYEVLVHHIGVRQCYLHQNLTCTTMQATGVHHNLGAAAGGLSSAVCCCWCHFFVGCCGHKGLLSEL